jgi:dihydroorotase
MQFKPIKETILFKNAQVVDPFQEKVYDADILIEKGKIKTIGKPGLPAQNVKTVLDLKGLNVAPGFIDLHVHFREPGYEDRETLETGSRAALAGGFTQVCCMPNTEPAIDNQESVKFIYSKAANLPIKIYPIAAITKERKGEELTEMNELVEAGAVAFSDDGNPLQNGEIMRFALEYSLVVDKPVINHAEDLHLRSNGIMHEGKMSTRLGLPGSPALAETIMLYRDLRLAEFTGARLHVPHVSAAESVELIRSAKARGVKVTAEATPHHFSLTDEALRDFNTNLKVAPPLRLEADRQAIIAGLQDGTIDAIATDHAPHNIESKETAFDQAAFGMIGLETAFSLGFSRLVQPGHLTLLELVKKLTVNPAKIMQLELPELTTGTIANLTVFDPQEWWVFSRKNIYSRSYNTPFIGQEFTGRVKYVVSGTTMVSV